MEISPASHRKPTRRFQIIGVFVLVVGAVAGAYAGFGRNMSGSAELSLEAANVLPSDNMSGEKATGRALAKEKAEAAAAAEAERARQANEIAAREQQAAAASRSQPRTTEAPPVPSSCNDFSGNRALGCALLLEAGFGLEEMGCLDVIWTRESGWNEHSENRTTGAYGIPQALPASKMAVYGEDYRDNPVPQIRWGLSYITGRYGSPCGAWNFWQANHWY
jgi:hypothetical protein